MSCPLCKSENSKCIESVTFGEIRKIYRKNLGVELQPLREDELSLHFLHCQNCDLRYFDPLITGDEAFYNSLQSFEWYYPDEKNEFQFALKAISATDNVLEVGSGMGMFATLINQSNYTGLEFSINAIELAKKNNINIISQSVEDHAKLNPSKYDVACAFQVLEHVSNVNEFIEAMLKCLRPGGKLIISVPSYDSFGRFIPNFELDMPPHHVSKWTDRSLKSLENIFPLELRQIWHEPLQEVHNQTYAITRIYRKINHDWLGRKHKLIDHSILSKIVYKLSQKLSKFILPDSSLATGISVTAVYTKKF